MTFWPLLLPAGATAAGFALHGPWALAGVMGGAAAGLAAHRLGAGLPVAALAASIPPLAAAGPLALAVALVLGLVALGEATNTWWVLLAGLLGLLLPGPAASIAPPLAGAALLAVAPGPAALVGVPVALAAWALAPHGIPGVAVAALAAGGVARWVVGHPANVSMGRNLVRIGLVLAPAPAAAGFLVAALPGAPEHVWEVFLAAAVAGLLGCLLLAAHIGFAPILQSAGGHPGAWLAFTWGLPAAALGLALELGAQGAAGVSWGLAGLTALPAAVGFAWLLQIRKR